MDNLESLPQQIVSLSGVALQNGRALDLLTAEQEGTYIGQEVGIGHGVGGGGVVSVLMNMDLMNRAHRCLRISAEISELTMPQVPWYSNPLVALFLPFLGPIQDIGTFLLWAPVPSSF